MKLFFFIIYIHSIRINIDFYSDKHLFTRHPWSLRKFFQCVVPYIYAKKNSWLLQYFLPPWSPWGFPFRSTVDVIRYKPTLSNVSPSIFYSHTTTQKHSTWKLYDSCVENCSTEKRTKVNSSHYGWPLNHCVWTISKYSYNHRYSASEIAFVGEISWLVDRKPPKCQQLFFVNQKVLMKVSINDEQIKYRWRIVTFR